jgi:hypothetical protein
MPAIWRRVALQCKLFAGLVLSQIRQFFFADRAVASGSFPKA